ncbi:hypothetical protein QBC40DRAFT_304383 [Triangularia verruculosa]|uniref:Cytochrome c oxidase assembly protein COX20, mitochondrial n=1 Tax=Triangularia verruculosa TaxID=2587418 RepID=A0AAN7AZZ7_9PEZI|nr:hypothetical protein QBC40DRAFT_304383 [Triangularia verruculosa]
MSSNDPPKPRPEQPPLPWVQTSSPSTPPHPPKPKSPTSEDLSLSAAVSTIKPADFLTVHQAPCSRTGLLTGIGVGSAVGAVRWLLGLPIPRAANWAVGTGAITAIIQYEYCQAKRRQEKAKVARVVEVYGQRQAEMRAKEEEQKRIKLEEEKRLQEESQKKSWWKIW